MGVLNAIALCEVVPHHADTLAEHVIIDLVDRAVDRVWCRPLRWRSIAAVWSEDAARGGRSAAATAAGVATAVNIGEGLAVEGVDGVIRVGHLRGKQHNQEGEEKRFAEKAHFNLFS